MQRFKIFLHLYKKETKQYFKVIEFITYVTKGHIKQNKKKKDKYIFPHAHFELITLHRSKSKLSQKKT